MIYADSGIIMRWVEGHQESVTQSTSGGGKSPQSDRMFVTSRIARLECRCKPLRDQRDDIVEFVRDLLFWR